MDFEDTHFKRQYLDEYTGDILQHDLIKEAIVEELKYFCEKEVWMLEDISKMKEIAGHIFVRSRWVVSNKGDVDEPDMRARLIACRINKGKKNLDFYASTPPLESKKCLCSKLATEQTREDQHTYHDKDRSHVGGRLC